MKISNNVAISESGFVFNASRGDSFTTNPIGLMILNFLKDNHTTEQIKAAVMETYDVDATTCEKDLTDFINMLKEYHLLER